VFVYVNMVIARGAAAGRQVRFQGEMSPLGRYDDQRRGQTKNDASRIEVEHVGRNIEPVFAKKRL